MHMICPFVSIPASAEFIEFLYLSCSKKITAPPFGAPTCWRLGHMLPVPGAALG